MDLLLRPLVLLYYWVSSLKGSLSFLAFILSRSEVFRTKDEKIDDVVLLAFLYPLLLFQAVPQIKAI